MKLTINIKDSKVDFFLELLRSFEDFVTVEEAGPNGDAELSEEHKALLDARLARYKDHPEELLDWEEVRSELENNL